MSEENEPVDFSGGSHDWLLDVHDLLRREDIPYILITASNRNHVSIHTGVTEDSAQLFMEALEDPDFINYIGNTIE